MNFTQLSAFLKRPGFILGLIILAFFLKGVLITVIFPFLNGQDENVHYNTVQYYAEPNVKDWIIRKNVQNRDKDVMESLNFSKEIEEAAKVIHYDDIRHVTQNTQPFTDGYDGAEEKEFNSKEYTRYNEDYPPNIVRKAFIYHFLLSRLEIIYSGQNIFFRFFSARIFSVILGTISILLFYLILKNIGFSQNHNLMITAIISFQPMFSNTSSFVNYDIAMIFSFALFILGAVLIIKNGLNWKNILILLSALLIGLLSKGTAVVLIPVAFLVLLFAIFKKKENKKKFIACFLILAVILLIASWLAYSGKYNLESFFQGLNNKNYNEIYSSLSDYLRSELSFGRLKLTSHTYWGNMGIISKALSDNIRNTIWMLEAISVIGIMIFLILKKNPDFLPQKRYIIFFLIMIAALQIGIRFVDWRLYEVHEKIMTGAPGRYFLPSILPHIGLMVVGIGTILRKKIVFDTFLALTLIAMFAFSIHSMLNLLIARFYE